MQEHPEYQFSTSIREGILEIAVKGKLTMQTMDTFRSEVIAIIRESHARALLFDHLESTGPHEIVDAYYRPRSLPADIKMLPVAIVENSEDFYYQSFFEATAANVGMTIKWFTDIERARKWLKSRMGQQIKS